LLYFIEKQIYTIMRNTLIMPLLLFIAFALSGNLNAQDKKVSSIVFKNFERMPDQKKDTDLLLIKKELKDFDDKGRMNKYELFLANPIGELVKNSSMEKKWLQYYRTEELAKYDEMGDLLMTIESFFSTKSNWKMKEQYTDNIKAPGKEYTKNYGYTTHGKPEKITLTNEDDRKVGEEIYKYNKTDEETFYKKWEIYPDGSKYTQIKKTAYTKEGYLASSEKLVKDGDDTYKDLITFQRNKIKEHLKFKNGEQISSFGGSKAGYNPNKARVLMDFGGGGDGFGLWVHEDEFDDKGKKIKTTQLAGEEVIQLTTYSYDKESNLTETKKISYDHGKETATSKEVLEYDRYKNILKKALYKDGKKITENTYDYKYY
jgi:hypothetical protein